EAAQAMGCRRWHIIWHVLLPEARPGIVGGFTITLVTMINSSADGNCVTGGCGGAGATGRRPAGTQLRQTLSSRGGPRVYWRSSLTGPPLMKLDPQTLAQITATTVSHYNRVADDFREGTRDHDVSQNIDALLRHIEGSAPWQILDFGCGPGRDLKTFTAMGHVAVGLDGSERFAEMARAETGCEVFQQNFLELDLPQGRFDGIFANAVLFHIPRQELSRVLRELHTTLKPGGVLFSSNPRGENQEGWNGERYGAYHDLETWRQLLTDAGFTELEHYYRPAGLPRDQQPWLASVWRR
ncbi:hypothetical protein A235_28278, partial [Pseudomonas syringae pv. actinidiae ICMP 19079]